MTNYIGKALTTGCNDHSECYVKTELMDMNTISWQNGQGYSFTSSWVLLVPSPSWIHNIYISYFNSHHTSWHFFAKEVKNRILRRIRNYFTSSTSDAAYIIGGIYTRDIIAEFKNDAWRQLGTLEKGHGSIILNDETMVIGGYSFHSDEGTKTKCLYYSSFHDEHEFMRN